MKYILKNTGIYILIVIIFLIILLYLHSNINTELNKNSIIKTVTKSTGETVTEIITETTTEVIAENSNTEVNKIYIGNYELTAYCHCELCCNYWSNINNPITASGAVPKENLTIAMDDNIPFGTKVMINNHIYIVEDRGGSIQGNKIDIYFTNHEEALKFGIQYADVYIIPN